ncbi:MAG TPA: M48 family peptidase [Gammaproteobacteria bacterium]|nr:M48 family peptidase [Gammaproteobacteria bacterium]
MSKTLPRTLLAVLLATLFPFVVYSDSGPDRLPDFGDSAGALISPRQERALGEAFMRSVRRQARLVDDPLIHTYIRQLGRKLVAASDMPAYPFSFFVVEDSAVNAFAGPGGYIGIHTGLITAAEYESELAGVMAHEIAHVTQRHLLRAYESARQMSLPTAAATIAAVLLGAAAGSTDAAIAGATAVQAGSIQYQLNFTRANEKEADRIGIQMLAGAGIDPSGMPAFFERLYQSNRLYGAGNIPEFLSTHPVTSDRMAETQERAREMAGGGRRDSLAFQLVRTRLLVLSSPGPRQLLPALPAQGTPAQRYGRALVLARTGHPRQAEDLLRQLHASDPDRIMYRIDLAQQLLEQGRREQGLALLKATLVLYPGDLAVGRAYAEALLAAGRDRDARDVVLALLRDETARTPDLYALWARSTSRKGPAWETRFASAEAYYLQGNLPLAIDQLEQALALKGLTEYDQARIRSRLEFFKARQAERTKRE